MIIQMGQFKTTLEVLKGIEEKKTKSIFKSNRRCIKHIRKKKTVQY